MTKTSYNPHRDCAFCAQKPVVRCVSGVGVCARHNRRLEEIEADALEGVVPREPRRRRPQRVVPARAKRAAERTTHTTGCPCGATVTYAHGRGRHRRWCDTCRALGWYARAKRIREAAGYTVPEQREMRLAT